MMKHFFMLFLFVYFFTNSLHAESKTKAELTFTYGDDNVLRGPGETRKNSPKAYFGNQMGTPLDRVFPTDIQDSLMLMNLHGKITNNLHLMPEGQLLLNFNINKGKFYDVGSYIRLNYFSDPVKQDKTLFIDFYPLNSNSIHLGYMPDLVWGGDDTFPKNFRDGPVPAVRFGFNSKKLYSYFAVKTALIRSPSEDILDNPGGNTNKLVQRTNYGFLGAFGVDFSGFKVEAGGGFFQKGTNSRANVLGKPIYAGGGSMRLSFQSGIPIGNEITMKYQFQDPLAGNIFLREKYDTGFSFYAGIEGSYLVQTLEDPDHIHSTKNEFSKAFGAVIRMKYRYMRVHLIGMYRDLTYIVFNVPGFVPYQALSEDVEVKPEIYTALSVDYHFPKIDLTSSLTGGIIFPATYKGIGVPEGQNMDQVGKGVQKIVVTGSDSANWNILPEGEDELPVFMVKLAFKWYLTKNFVSLLELFYERDNNIAQVFRDEKGHAVRTFDKPDILGFGLLIKMNF